MSKKKVFLSIFALLVGIILAACGASNGNQTNDSDSKTISMMGWYSENEMEPVIEAVNKELGDELTVEYSFVPLQQYNNVLSTQLSSEEGPDIITDGASFPSRIKSENLLDISNEAFIQDFNENGFALATAEDGKIYGIPSYGWFSGIWYNKEIFETNGIEVPKTYDEFLQVCEKLSTLGIVPIGFGLSDSDSGNHSLIGYLENSFYRDEANKDFDEQFAYGKAKMAGVMNDAVDRWKRIIDDGYMNEKMLGISGDQNMNMFINGEIAMMNGGPWNYANLEEAGMDVGMFSHLGDTESDNYLIGGPAVSLGVNKNTKNETEAKKVLAAFASLEVQQTWVDANPGGFSYRKEVKVDTPDAYALVQNELDNGRVACAWDRWGVNMPAETFLTEWKKQIQNLVSNQVTTEEFLENLDKKADEIRYKE